METKFRINHSLYTKIRASKHTCTIDKTMYAKKLGLITYHSRDIVVDVLGTEKEAKEKVNKLLIDFFSDDEQRKINEHVIKYVVDDVRCEFLIICDKDLYIQKSGIKFINEEDFKNSIEYVDDNHVPLRVNFNHLGKVLQERNIRAKGDDSVLTQKYEVQKTKMTFGKIFSGIIDMIPVIGDLQI